MIYTVDRMEGPWAVLEEEGGRMVDLPRTQLPPGLREGDKLERREGGWTLRPDLRAQQLAKNRALLEKLRHKRKQP